METTIIKITIPYIECNYFLLLNSGCDFDNCTTEEIYGKLKNEVIKTVPNKSEIIYVDAKNNYTFQVTTVNNELEKLSGNETSNLSVIDFKECSDLLKDEYGLDDDIDLIILKYENNTSNANEKSVQYEVYAPNTNTKLNLSVCSNVKIDIYIPVELSQDTKNLYNDLKSKGYNLFDKNDKFYTDICTPYESEDGTDVLLADRYNKYFTENQLTCQANCEYADYSSESKYLKCECNVVDEEKIEIKYPEKITAKAIFKSFFDILKYSNYKVLSCYALVFIKLLFTKNYGFILAFIYFLGYIASFILFLYKRIYYLKLEIQKLFRRKHDIRNVKPGQNNIKGDLLIFNKKNIIGTENIDIKPNSKRLNINNNLNIKIENSENVNMKKENLKEKDEMGQVPPKKRSDYAIKLNDKKIEETDKTPKGNSEENKNLKSKELLTNKLTLTELQHKTIITNQDQKKDLNIISKKNLIITETKKKEEPISDFEMNNLEYLIALELDNRPFIRVYWSLLKREHTIIFTFFAWNDYNIFSIKLSKFFFLICTDMCLNVFFFSDESMHNLYESGGSFDFFGQIVQFIYTTIVSQVLQIFLNYLTMTDIHYYQIKRLKDDKISKSTIISIINCIKYKIIAFYIFTFLLFLFYMYTIAAFCAVYQNTQIIFIIDSITSFLIGLAYPFALYFIPTGLRILALRAKEKKNLKPIYWMSDIIPFF